MGTGAKALNSAVLPCRLSKCLPAIVLLFLGPGVPLRANTPNQIYEFHAGVHTSRQYPLTKRQMETLLAGLRFSTGLTEMQFDKNGRLDPGDCARVTGGSMKARHLLMAAVDSPDSFILENRYHSPTVAFAKIADVADYFDGGGQKHLVWQVSLDFFDFSLLHGDRLTLAAFDPTLTLLHELTHGVLKLKDPQDASDSLGDCERHLNLIRAELGLPERLTYLPRQQLRTGVDSDAQVVQAEFIFVQKNPHTGKQSDLYLTFDLGRVHDLGRNIAF